MSRRKRDGVRWCCGGVELLLRWQAAAVGVPLARATGSSGGPSILGRVRTGHDNISNLTLLPIPLSPLPICICPESVSLLLALPVCVLPAHAGVLCAHYLGSSSDLPAIVRLRIHNDDSTLGAMTSRPGPGIHESLQSRGGGVPPRNQVRPRLSKPASTLIQPDAIDPNLEDEQHHGAPEPTRPLPRGRPQLYFSTVATNGIELPIHPFPYQPTTTLPVPPRPGSVHLRDASQQRRILPGGTGVKDPPKLTPPEAIPPPVHFPGGKAADVFPWTGNNAEDTLSESLVKAGISNKPQIMNETNTARPSLWSNLKNKSGLSTLSTLFVAVLEKRQQSGRIQTPNTFKPPPRLTLRDSTREQWLHDLANSTIGLRRLSRTIPHGLTGKVLLEQCLNKNIPLPRALWLAKCVGINELRAHKRKGQAGTVTWGRGWTSSVEQFLDSVISTVGQGDWKPRVTYS